MSGGELILYTTEDGRAEVQLRAEDGTVWLTQAQIAALFQTTPQNITQHIRSVYAEGELQEGATCKERLQVRQEGARQVSRTVRSYSLDVILAVGYVTRPLYYTRQVGLARGQRKARRVHPADLLASPLRVPPRDVQDRIADVLTTSQCEIDISKRQLEALKLQKRGLMQKLLTGQWRLPVRGQEPA